MYTRNINSPADPLLTLCTPCSTRLCSPQTSKNTFTTLYEHMMGWQLACQLAREVVVGDCVGVTANNT